MKCIAFDLETTSTDPASAEVVQAAIVSATWLDHKAGLSIDDTHSRLFAARDVPAAATAVHRVTDRDPERFDFPVRVIPEDAPSFVSCVQSMVGTLLADDAVSVSYNGIAYDIPIIARCFAMSYGSGCAASAVEQMLRERHIDVMRLWLRIKSTTTTAVTAWQDKLHDTARGWWPTLTADMFAGSLTAAHGFFLGEGFGSAHDASADCRATLAVLEVMLCEGFVPDIETAIAWSNAPKPGDVDFDGKFRWEGDRAVLAIGKKHANTPIEEVPKSYLSWMLSANFPASTKRVVADFLKGVYPVREGEA